MDGRKFPFTFLIYQVIIYFQLFINCKNYYNKIKQSVVIDTCYCFIWRSGNDLKVDKI